MVLITVLNGTGETMQILSVVVASLGHVIRYRSNYNYVMLRTRIDTTPDLPTRLPTPEDRIPILTVKVEETNVRVLLENLEHQQNQGKRSASLHICF
jgi:hypothetical protein